MRFSAVTPEFTTLEYVQQASIITGVSLTTFARGRDADMPGWLHARLCHVFSDRNTIPHDKKCPACGWRFGVMVTSFVA